MLGSAGSATKLTCPDCGAVIPAEDINIDRALAKCRACNAVVDVEQALRGRGGAPTPGKRPRVPQPPAIKFEQFGNGMRLARRWFVWSVVFLTFFCIAWDSFLIFWYSVALRPGGPLIMVVFPVVHVAVGVGLTYFTLAIYLNRTTLEVDESRLTVRIGPLPWPGNRNIEVGDLEAALLPKEHFTKPQRLGVVHLQRVRRAQGRSARDSFVQPP